MTITNEEIPFIVVALLFLWITISRNLCQSIDGGLFFLHKNALEPFTQCEQEDAINTVISLHNSKFIIKKIIISRCITDFSYEPLFYFPVNQ